MYLKKPHPFSQQGMSLIEVLVAVGIMSIVTLAIMSLISGLQKDQLVLTEKLLNSSTKNLLLVAMSNAATCNSQIVLGTPSPIDLSAATTTVPSPNFVDYTELRMGTQPTSPIVAKVGVSLSGVLNRMVVQTIRLTNILETGVTNQYVGEWTITLDKTTTTQVYQPVKLQQIFNTSGAAATSIILGCGSTGANPTFYAEQMLVPTGAGGSINPASPTYPLNAPTSPATFISTQDMAAGNYTVVMNMTTRPNRCGGCWVPAIFTVSINGVTSTYSPTSSDDDENENASLRSDTLVIRNITIPWLLGAQPLRFTVSVGKLPTGGGSGLEAFSIQAIKQ